jgi:hypothetical protein
MLKSLLEPDNLIRSGHTDEARDSLLQNLQKSLDYNNPYMEYSFLSKTVVRESEAGNSSATEIPVRRILEMRRQIHSGPSMRSHPTQIIFDHAQYGAAMIQAGDFDTAISCFITANYHQYEDFTPLISKEILSLWNMEEFVSIVLWVARSSLISMMMLPRTTQSTYRRALQATQYTDIETSFRALLLQKAIKVWQLSNSGMRQLEHDVLPGATVTNQGITSGGNHHTFQELRTINDKHRIARLLGQSEAAGFVYLQAHVNRLTIDGPNLPRRMDLSALQRYLPSQQDSLDRMPDYLWWWRPELRSANREV